MRRLAVLLLLDARGWILLQERDSGAPVAPDQWGMVGGHVEDGESFEEAAYRELLEETGQSLTLGTLALWESEEFTYADGHTGHYHVFTAQVSFNDNDIVVGEGRQIVFVDPAAVPSLDKSESCAHFVPKFLASQAYKSQIGAISCK